MSETIGQGVIVVSADSTQLKAGIEDAKRSVRTLGKEVGSSVQAGSQQATRSIEAYIRKVELSAQNVGKTAKEVKLLELSQRGATEDQLKRADAALSTLDSFKKQQQAAREASETSRKGALLAAAAQTTHGQATKLTAFQTQQLSYQLNDLFVQIASGGGVIRPLIQQGSQLSGAFGGIGNTFRALGSVLTPARVAIGGIAAAVVGLGAAYAKGASDSAAFNRAILLTGNYAGITEGRYNRMAQAIAQGTNTTIGSARETLQTLVASGRFGTEAGEKAANAVQLLAKATGKSTEEIAKNFADAAKNPTQFAEALNDSYNFLDGSTFKLIKRLSEQGDTQKALVVTFDALNGRLQTASKEVTGLEALWQKLKNAFSEKLEGVVNIVGGRTATPEQQLEDLQKQLNDRLTRGPLGNDTGGAFEKGNARLREQISTLQDAVRETGQLADKAGMVAQRREAGFKFAKREEAALTERKKLEREMEDIEKEGVTAGKTRAEIIALQGEAYKRSGVFAQDAALKQQRLEERIAAVRRAEELGTAEVGRESEELEAKRSAMLISEAAYYSARRELIDSDARYRISSLEQQRQQIAAEAIMAKDGADAARQESEKRIKLADIDAKIVIERANAASKLNILDTEQAGIVRKLAVAYLEAAQAQISYVDGLKRQQALDIALIGVGNDERQRLQGRAQILEKYTQDLERIENEKNRKIASNQFGANEDAQYQRELSLIETFKAKALQSYDEYTRRRIALEGQWETGASESIANYLASVRNVASQVEGAFDNAFKGMEDALVGFVTTGKLSFTSLANSILADVTRIIVRTQITGPLAQGLQGQMSSGSGVGGWLTSLAGSLFGGGAGLGTPETPGINPQMRRAIGGPVSAGGAYRVGESGAEVLNVAGRQYLLMGEQGGSVTPGGAGGGGDTYHTVVNVQATPGMTRGTALQQGAAIGDGIQRALARSR